MNSFKPGNWVRHIAFKSKHKCISINDGEFDDKVSVTNSPSFDNEFMIDYELWQPKVGEWVWSKGSYTQAFIFKWTSSHEQAGIINYTNYEPFIGQLPTFIKDQS